MVHIKVYTFFCTQFPKANKHFSPLSIFYFLIFICQKALIKQPLWVCKRVTSKVKGIQLLVN